MRIGILTGGGDCPGLNAVIRAVVRKGIGEYGDEIVGFRDGWRGVLEADTVPMDLQAVRGILPRGGTVLGTSRTNPYGVEGGAGPGDGDPGAARHRRTGPDRRRGHPRRRHEARRGRRPRRRRPEDDRQRPGLHRLHVRLRHRRRRGDGGDRPAAHHRRQPPPHARRRGDGPARRLDRAARRAWPAAPTSSSSRRSPFDVDAVVAHCSTASTPATRRSSSSPRAPRPRTAAGARHRGEGRLRARPARRHR